MLKILFFIQYISLCITQCIILINQFTNLKITLILNALYKYFKGTQNQVFKNYKLQYFTSHEDRLHSTTYHLLLLLHSLQRYGQEILFPSSSDSIIIRLSYSGNYIITSLIIIFVRFFHWWNLVVAWCYWWVDGLIG